MNGLTKAIEHFGTASALADALSVKPATISQWKDRKRPIPVERALEIERATGGAVTCEELRPDVDWSRADPQKVAA